MHPCFFQVLCIQGSFWSFVTLVICCTLQLPALTASKRCLSYRGDSPPCSGVHFTAVLVCLTGVHLTKVSYRAGVHLTEVSVKYCLKKTKIYTLPPKSNFCLGFCTVLLGDLGSSDDVLEVLSVSPGITTNKKRQKL